MIVTTYICDCCGAQSTDQTKVSANVVPSAAANTASMLCSDCATAIANAALAVLNQRKGTRSNVTI